MAKATKDDLELEPQDYVRVQDFRAHMRQFLCGDRPVVLGSSWNPRGIVLPLKQSDRWGDENKRKRQARLRRQFAAVLKAL